MELMSDDWQRKFIDRIVKGFDASIQDLKIDVKELRSDLTTHMAASDRRIERLENKQASKASKSPVWKDPKVVFIIFQTVLVIASIILILVAKLNGVEIGNIL